MMGEKSVNRGELPGSLCMSGKSENWGFPLVKTTDQGSRKSPRKDEVKTTSGIAFGIFLKFGTQFSFVCLSHIVTGWSLYRFIALK